MLHQRYVLLLALAAVTFAGCARHGRGSAAEPSTTPANASRGSALFSANCAACHGENGTGGRIGPSLIGIGKREPLTAIGKEIAHPDPPMPKLYPAVLSKQDLNDLTAYVGSL